jgi:hypothetical protein
MMHHILGDSFVNEDTALNYRTVLARPSVSVTHDGVGGSTLPEQADRLALDIASHGKLLLIYEGLEVNAATAIAAIDEMRATITHDYWLYVETIYKPDQGLDSETRGFWEATHAALKAYAGDRHVDTYEALAAAAISDPEDPGYAQDQADAANGVCPTSCRVDDAHPNAKGKTVRNQCIRERMVALGGCDAKGRRLCPPPYL